MQGKVQDSVRIDILGHEGSDTMTSVYDDEAELQLKLDALVLLSPLTAALEPKGLELRPADRRTFGTPRGRLPRAAGDSVQAT